MTELEPFKPPFPANGYMLRVDLEGGEPWFAALDACGMLKIADVRRAVERLDQDDRRQAPLEDSAGRRNPMGWWINESGLYELIMRSDKPEARVFRRWVTSEVLPSIRKTGSYGAPALPTSPRELAMMVIAEADRADRATAELEAAKPAIEAHAAYLDATGTMSMGTTAQVLGIGQNTLFRELRERKVLIGSAGVRLNTPYQPYIAPRGWFVVKAGTRERSSGETEATFTTRVTPKGLEGIRKLLAG